MDLNFLNNNLDIDFFGPDCTIYSNQESPYDLIKESIQDLKFFAKKPNINSRYTTPQNIMRGICPEQKGPQYCKFTINHQELSYNDQTTQIEIWFALINEIAKILGIPPLPPSRNTPATTLNLDDWLQSPKKVPFNSTVNLLQQLAIRNPSLSNEHFYSLKSSILQWPILQVLSFSLLGEDFAQLVHSINLQSRCQLLPLATITRKLKKEEQVDFRLSYDIYNHLSYDNKEMISVVQKHPWGITYNDPESTEIIPLLSFNQEFRFSQLLSKNTPLNSEWEKESELNNFQLFKNAPPTLIAEALFLLDKQYPENIGLEKTLTSCVGKKDFSPYITVPKLP
ncbi:MAG: hypothetical protein CMO81_00400 [Waddliaceae bacterium]|nr:hypothetical protein [Waddliaceae bacterium]